MSILLICLVVCLVVCLFAGLFCNTDEYRIVTNGSKYKVQYRALLFPFWSDCGIISALYDTIEEAQKEINSRKLAEEFLILKRTEKWRPIK